MNRSEYDKAKTALIQSMVFKNHEALEDFVCELITDYEISGTRRWIDGIGPKPTNTFHNELALLIEELEEDPQ